MTCTDVEDLPMTFRRKLLAAFGASAVALAVPFAAVGQQPGKVFRIGFLSASTRASVEHLDQSFLRSLRELGWVEGKNLVLEYRWAEGQVERLPELAAELVRNKVDLIVASAGAAALAAQASTATIPIIFAAVSDPVGNGLIKSLARPGGNITGRTNITGDLAPKRLEWLLAVVPAAKRVVVLLDSTIKTDAQAADNLEAAARTRGVIVTRLGATTPQLIDAAFAAIARDPPDGLIVSLNPLFFRQRRQIAELAAKQRLPAIGGDSNQAEAGFLMSYGASLTDEFRRLATYADRIFKGAKPADLPVEQPTNYELVINRKTAKALGLTLTHELLLRADLVID